MKTLLVALTLLALSTAALAFPGPDSIGFYPDPDATETPELFFNTTAGFEEITLYLLVTNPTGGGVSGWEAVVDIEGTPTAGGWTTPGIDVNNASDTDIHQRFQIGLGTGSAALMPNAQNAVLLSTYKCFVLNTSTVLKFYVSGIPGSLTFPNEVPGYAAFDDEGDFYELSLVTGGEDTPVFCVNENCNLVGNEELSFSGVKTLFR